MSLSDRNPRKSYMLLTVDVEDWFQVENLKKYISASDWRSCESRVERNTHRLLDFLDGSRADDAGETGSVPDLRATFFVLGWIARRLPGLVREIHERGHEVASHGVSHQLCENQSRRELMREMVESKKLLEDLTGARVFGYRAPSFSVTQDMLAMLEACGYSYDSSFNSFSVNRRYGRLDLSESTRRGVAFELSPHFHEIPISNFQLGRFVLPIGGGGYFRLIPFHLFRRGVQWNLKHHGAHVFYIHPWEIDPEQPRVSRAKFLHRVRHYFNLSSTLGKLSSLVSCCKETHFVTCREYLVAHTSGSLPTY